MALDFPASSASPFTAPNGVVYTWNTDGYWEAKADPNDLDSDYLKLDATNGPVTGDLTFEGLTTHEDGVSVTGGTQTDGHIIGNADGSIVLNDSNRITLTSAADSGTGISMRVNNLDKTNNVIGLGITTGQTGRASDTTLNQVYSNLDTDCGSNAYAYVARSTAAHNTSGITVTGYYTALNNSDAPNGSVYSFYAGGTAPNYLAGGVQFDLTHSQGGTQDQLMLDNYEEGSWTPSFGSSGMTAISYDTGTTGARYVRIGSSVYCYGRIVVNNLNGTNPTGNLTIAGLPFKSINGQAYRNCGTIVANSGTFQSYLPTSCIVSNNTNSAGIYHVVNDTTNNNTSASQLSDNSTIRFSFTYESMD